MKATHEVATDKRVLIKVVFERESPNADSPTIEVVFQVYFPETFSVDGNIRTLFWLSATRVDTREVFFLTEEEIQEVIQTAGDHAAEMAPGW